ncbi:unnamed protein product [Effrenium voratum]|uniref:Uncharacterized protein n=1 Tax=Effrenium voratum TaxID=2562239 RepID=A0AA36MJ38_9DINO|nr:unnamed protein product [Effrenium voratum]
MRTGQEPRLEILWNEKFFHGQILMDRRAGDRLFSRMRQLVREEAEGGPNDFFVRIFSGAKPDAR